MKLLSRTLVFFIIVSSVFGEFAFAQIKRAVTVSGIVEGEVLDGVASFKGIPFAEPPIGKLRWKSPEPRKNWQGIREAKSFAPSCMQNEFMLSSMSPSATANEDCLYLNVWTAAKNKGEKRPVIVWVYGAAFSGGTTSTPVFDGTHLSEMGVLLVSVAHRVGPFGFLAHPELSKESGKGSGNYGLEDVIFALQWVQNNIDKFGGDPDNVTIAGVSSGGGVASMLAASPMGEGLFHKVISESGASFMPIRIDEYKLAQNVLSLEVAERFGNEFLSKLEVKNIREARNLSAKSVQESLLLDVNVNFWPVVDDYVIFDDQYKLYQRGKFNDVPILIGTNSDGGAMFSPPKSTPEKFARKVRSDGYGKFSDSILDIYPHSNENEASAATRNLFRDSRFGWATWAWANLHDEFGISDAFLYHFDHRTPSSPNGSNHASEVAYVFGTLENSSGDAISDEDQIMSDMVSHYWVNFATGGNPNGPGLPQWPEFDRSKQKLMYFGEKSGQAPVPNKKQLKLFEEYYAWRRQENQ